MSGRNSVSLILLSLIYDILQESVRLSREIIFVGLKTTVPKDFIFIAFLSGVNQIRQWHHGHRGMVHLAMMKTIAQD